MVHSELNHETISLLIHTTKCSNSHPTTTDCNSFKEDLNSTKVVKKASFRATVLNIVKACMGTGCLALPYACQQGGICLFIVGHFIIAGWNSYCMFLLIDCLEHIPTLKSIESPIRETFSAEKLIVGSEKTRYKINSNTKLNENSHPSQECNNERLHRDSEIATCYGSTATINDAQSTTTNSQCEKTTRTDLLPDVQHYQEASSAPVGTSTMGLVAWYALGGSKGLVAIDVCQFILLLGIVVAYIEAVLGFVRDIAVHVVENNVAVSTIVATKIDSWISFFVVITMTFLSTVIPNIGTISGYVSVAGLITLLCSFIPIAIYGYYCNFQTNDDGNASNDGGNMIFWKMYTNDTSISSNQFWNNTEQLQSTPMKLSSGKNSLVTFFLSYMYHSMTTSSRHDSSQQLQYHSRNTYHWFVPSSSAGWSNWFGIVVFGYGVVPLTYSFYHSMEHPSQLVQASTVALMCVAFLYSVMGVTLYLLYPDLQGDIIQAVPIKSLLHAHVETNNMTNTADTHGIWNDIHSDDNVFAIVVRLTMTITILLSSPLLIIPLAELVESKILLDVTPVPVQQSKQQETNVGIKNIEKNYVMTTYKKAIVRFSILTLCTFCAISLPGFVQVLSLVGCFCIATVGFCMPPVLHGQLLLKKYFGLQQSKYISNTAHVQAQTSYIQKQHRWQIGLDLSLFAWGVFTTITSTAYVLHQIIYSQ